MGNEEKSAPEVISRFWTKINLMAEISVLFRDNPPETKTYHRALRVVQKVVPFCAAALYLSEKNTGHLKEVCFYGDKCKPFDYIRSEAGASLINELSGRMEPVLLSSANHKSEGSAPLYDGSILIIPLIVDESLIGLIQFAGDGAAFSREKDIKLLSIIADQIAVSIERSIYQKELEDKNSALEKARKDLIAAQKRVIDNERLIAVKELAVSLNHEINNPLSVITGNVEYLLYIHGKLDETIIERLNIIQSEALRIAETNRRLLEIQSLVTEAYVKDRNIKMINLQKSSAGLSDE